MQGTTLLGETTVHTDGNGHAAISFSPSNAASAGQFITATATDPPPASTIHNTSEFSNAVAVTSNNPHNVSASRSNFTVNHGQPFRATVAYFTDDPSFTPSDYHIVIDWGDGTPTSGGSVIADSKHPGHFMIFGTHNYAAKVNRNVHVTIFDNNNHQLASVQDLATVH